MDKNQSTVASIVTHLDSPEAARVWAAEKHKKDVKDAFLDGLLYRMESRARACRTTAQHFQAESDEAHRKSHDAFGTLAESIHAYTEGYYKSRTFSCLEEADFLEQLAKDLRQVLATPTKAI